MHVSKLVSYAIGVVGVTTVGGYSAKPFTLQTCDEYFWFHCVEKNIVLTELTISSPVAMYSTEVKHFYICAVTLGFI